MGPSGGNQSTVDRNSTGIFEGRDSVPDVTQRPPRRRDRHGRGLRGMLAQRPVPIAHSRGDVFDAMVLQAVDHLQPRLGDKLANVEFAVEDVPEVTHRGAADFDFDEDVLDDNAVPLSRLFRSGVAGIDAPVIVLYRRPLETRAPRNEDLADLVHDVVVEQVARLLGRSADEIDPPA
jgi:predicted Zn-dependent protease with MMP-like domain